MLPQIIYFILLIFGLGVSAAKHGEYKEKQNNFWNDLFITALSFGLMWWGGFFKPMGF